MCSSSKFALRRPRHRLVPISRLTLCLPPSPSAPPTSRHLSSIIQPCVIHRVTAPPPLLPPLSHRAGHCVLPPIAAAADDPNLGEPLLMPPAEIESDYVQVAVVLGPHGVRGEVKVLSSTDFEETRLVQGGRRYLQLPRDKAALYEVTLVKGRPSISQGKAVHLLRIKEITTREQAEELKVCRPPAERPQCCWRPPTPALVIAWGG